MKASAAENTEVASDRSNAFAHARRLGIGRRPDRAGQQQQNRGEPPHRRSADPGGPPGRVRPAGRAASGLARLAGAPAMAKIMPPVTGLASASRTSTSCARPEGDAGAAARQRLGRLRRSIRNRRGRPDIGTSPLAPLSTTVTNTPNRCTPEMRAANVAPTLSAM